MRIQSHLLFGWMSNTLTSCCDCELWLFIGFRANQTDLNGLRMPKILLSNREGRRREGCEKGRGIGALQDCVCMCVRVGDRGAPCLFHWLAPVTTYQQHTKPPEDNRVSFTRSIFFTALILPLTVIVDRFTPPLFPSFHFLLPFLFVSLLHIQIHVSF